MVLSCWRNFKLCCFYFFPNYALRNRGCGLYTDVYGILDNTQLADGFDVIQLNGSVDQPMYYAQPCDESGVARRQKLIQEVFSRM